MKLRASCRCLCLLTALLLGGATDAVAQQQPAAVIVLPFFTASSSTLTQFIVTNTQPTGLIIELRLIEGTGGNWEVESYQCHLTGHEVLAIWATPIPANRARFDSSSLSCNTLRIADTSNGLLFITAHDPGDMSQVNQLTGVATVIEAGGPAYSVDAVSFFAGPVTNTDDVFVFDDLEFSRFPASVHGQILVPDTHVSSELVLFTLDGPSGFPVPVNVDIILRDDNAQARTLSTTFDCFTVVDIGTLDPSFNRTAINSEVASVEVIPSMTGMTIRPVWGWLINRVAQFGPWAGTGNIMSTSAGGARMLTRDALDFVPEPGGLVSFDDD